MMHLPLPTAEAAKTKKAPPVSCGNGGAFAPYMSLATTCNGGRAVKPVGDGSLYCAGVCER